MSYVSSSSFVFMVEYHVRDNHQTHEKSVELVKEVAAMFRCFFVADFLLSEKKLGKSVNVGLMPRIQ